MSREQIRAAGDLRWQQLRLSMRQATTQEKLGRLDAYLQDAATRTRERQVRYIQVQDYLNVLARQGKIVPTNKGTSVRSQIRDARVPKARKPAPAE